MKIAHRVVPAIIAATALCLRLLPLAASPGRIHRSPDLQQTLLKAYIQRDDAIHRYDLNTAIAFYRPDYQFTTVSGKHDSLASLQKRLKRLLATGMKDYTWKTTYRIENCAVKGTVATIRMQYVKRQTEFQTPRRPQYYATEMGKSQDEWVLAEGRWHERSAMTLTDRTTLSRTPIASP